MTDRRPLPGYYDDLGLSLDHAFHMLGRAVADRRAPFHTPALATVDSAGEPQVRTVVLRHWDQAARCLRFHTDVRSGKAADIARIPAVAVHFYDPGAKLQLRASGTARLVSEGHLADDAWLRSQAQSRICYAAVRAPGAAIAVPEPVSAANTLDDIGARANFAALLVTLTSLEWLYLAAEGHRRARWQWTGEAWAGIWIQP